MMKKTIGKFEFVGWCQWKPKDIYLHRAIYLFPYIRLWYGKSKTTPRFISRCIFNIEFGWLYWNGQISSRVTT
jgi:hypothetical protein